MNHKEGKVDKAIVTGSIKAVAKGGDVALAMLDAKIVLLCDRSSSMLEKDAFNRKARYEVEDQIVKRLQTKYPGQIVLVSFRDWSDIHPNGELPHPSGMTNMTAGLEKAQPLIEAGLRAVLISDGEPDDPYSVMELAKQLKGKLDVCYVGPEGSGGQQFLHEVARVAMGTFDTNDLKNPQLLEERITRLLLKAGT